MAPDATNVADGGSIPSGGTDRTRATRVFPTRTSTADCSADYRAMEVQILPGGPWQKPKPSRREAVNLVLVGASPIGHSNVSCRRRPTGRSHCSQKAGSVGSNPTGGTSSAAHAPDPRMGRDVANVDGDWFESYRWHDTSGCSSAVRARGRGPRGRWCDSSHSDHSCSDLWEGARLITVPTRVRFSPLQRLVQV